MALFCFACHRSFAEASEVCPHDSYALTEANMEFPPSMTVASHNLEFQSCVFPGEHIRIYKTIDKDSGKTLLLETYASQIIDSGQFESHLGRRSQLSNDQIAPCLAYGALESGIHYVLSELPHGVSMAERMEQHGEMKADKVVHLFNQMLGIMNDLKSSGIFHGNVMPASCIFVDDPKIPDKLILTSMALPGSCFVNLSGPVAENVSPLYLSPERVEGQSASELSEIYSVGALMYEALTGLPAYSGKSLEELHSKHLQEQLLPLRGVAPELAIPAMLDNLTIRALNKDPRGRYTSFEVMQKEILYAAKESRIYLPAGANTKYSPSVFTEQSSEAPEVHEEEQDLEAKRVAEEAAKVKEEERKIDEEIQGKVKDLSKSFSMLAVVAAVVVIGAVSILFYQGSDEDKGPLWVKLMWEQQMSSADSALKSKNYESAVTSYEQALKTTDSIKDNDERAVKSLTGLLKAYEGKGDKANVEQMRKRLEEIEQSHLKTIEKE